MDIKGIPKRFYTRLRTTGHDGIHRDGDGPPEAGRPRPGGRDDPAGPRTARVRAVGLRSADRFEVDLDAADADEAADRADEMAERLLANPTIHDYEVAVAER